MRKRSLLTALAVLLWMTVACGVPAELPGVVTAPPPTAAALSGGPLTLDVGFGYAGPFYELYFTDPFNRAAQLQEGGPDAPLVAAIDAARLSVDMAVYSLSLTSVRDALARAQRRGVQVRIVMESDNLDRDVPNSLIADGINILGDRREGLMHNKFVVIDRAEVWTGSMNLTTSGTYDDNNNLIRIRSTKIAENYSTEFDEMYLRDLFGPDALAATPNPVVTVDGISVETLFSPDDKPARRIAELLRGATSSIYFMAYSFTANELGDILIDKARNGVAVAGVMEEEQIKSNQGTEFDAFAQAKMNVYADGNIGLMHHKVFIIDQQIVILGSYNFSVSAEKRNDENLLIIFDPNLAAQYLAEFQRVYAEVKR